MFISLCNQSEVLLITLYQPHHSIFLVSSLIYRIIVNMLSIGQMHCKYARGDEIYIPSTFYAFVAHTIFSASNFTLRLGLEVALPHFLR